MESDLADGASMQVRADSHEERDGVFFFGALANVPQAEQAQLDVSAGTPSDPDRVVVTLARIPTDMVEVIHSA